MEKRGQFYLIFAVIIIIVIAGLVATANYARMAKEPVKFYDLSEDYASETTKIIDYGVLATGTDLKSEVDAFSRKFLDYAQEKDPNLQLVYLYGNAQQVEIVNYATGDVNVITSEGKTIIPGGSGTSTSTISIQYGEKEMKKDLEVRLSNFMDVSKSLGASGGMIDVELAGVLHTFDLKTGDAFYYVITTEGEEEEVHAEEVK